MMARVYWFIPAPARILSTLPIQALSGLGRRYPRSFLI
jgi:hypothetical protein